MKTIGQIINQTNTHAVAQMKTIYKIWYSSITDILKNITIPYAYNAEEKSLIVLVYDNLWYNELSYMEEDFIDQLKKNGLELNKIKFKHTPKYEKLENNKNTDYTITKRAGDYINISSQKLENKAVAEHFKVFLTNFFHKNNFDEWILKG